MNTELKPGMMALVIGGLSENIGKIVTLQRIINNGDLTPNGMGYKGPSVWMASGKDIYARLIKSGMVYSEFGFFISKHLIPINQQAEPIHTKEEQHASA